jgi:hypothetical protein
MRRPSPSRARGARGQVSWVTLLLLTALVGGGYLGWVWVPLYITDFQANQIVRDFMNQAVKNRNDDRLVAKMVVKLRSLRTVELRTADGVEEVPAVDVSERDVVWERDRDSDPPMLHVAFDYTRVIQYPYLDVQDEKVFTVDLAQDISVPDWGPSR